MYSDRTMARPRGTGSVFKQTYKDRRSGQTRRSRLYSIAYYVPGRAKPVKEATGCRSKGDAEKILRQRLAAVDAGLGEEILRARDTAFTDLEALVLTDYVNNQRRVKRLHQSLAHLRGAFANVKPSRITKERIERYKAMRLEEGAAAATINRELSALHRAFVLAHDVGRVLAFRGA